MPQYAASEELVTPAVRSTHASRAPRTTASPGPSTTTRYRALLPIASGAMGTVHLGVQSVPSGDPPSVAIKRLHRGLSADLHARMMFRTEAVCLSSIRHENVVRFLDYDTTGGVQTLVMEYVDGATLSELAFTGERLPPAIALGIALQMCDGLAAIQSAKDGAGRPLGIVHRDLSPQNVMVDLSGVARVIDFGVARLGHDKDPGMFGKVSYMAPEMLMTGIATSATDLFAMAVVMWELFAGRRLDDPDVPSLRGAVGEVARALDPIFARALRREPGKRFGSVADLRRALEHTRITPATRKEIGAHVARLLGGQASQDLELAEEAPSPVRYDIPPPSRPAYFLFDVDRPTRRDPSAPGLSRAVKWAGCLALLGAIAGVTTAIAYFSDDPPEEENAQSLAR
ncbi:MAG: serine/threonine protein kinase [Deltaproteobacteria bacterium]|nr:serine/threonine protein kinase [Deltaproteobacteria bacterium]